MTHTTKGSVGAAALSTLLLTCQLSSAASSDKTLHGSIQPLTENAASARARRLLRENGIVESELQLVFREATTWSDSSLGCQTRAAMSLPVITRGETLRFSRGDRRYEVHVAGENAVLCAMLTTPRGAPRQAATSARTLSLMVGQARADLAQRLGVSPAEITVRTTSPTVWKNSDLGCVDASTANDGPVRGYRLLLVARAAQYIYHTDLHKVMACPPIEQR